MAGAGVAFVIAASRAGIFPLRSDVVALLGTICGVAAAAWAALASVRLVQEREGRIARGGEILALAGVAVVAAAGLANWALDFRGLLLLTEGEELPLANLRHYRAVAAGPLGNPGPGDAVVRLQRVELVRAPAGLAPRSRLFFTPRRGEPFRELVVEQARAARAGALTLHQGAFGFVPRVVVQREGQTIHDAYVPMGARRDAARGVSHEGTLTLEDGVVLTFAIDLSQLDEEMKGHPVLGVELRRGQEILGRGELLPGHGATMRDGWHVGFGGLKRWSEIDVSRGSFRGTALAGMVIAVVGAAVWIGARVRRRGRGAGRR
jgi:hypothetical protein